MLQYRGKGSGENTEDFEERKYWIFGAWNQSKVYILCVQMGCQQLTYKKSNFLKVVHSKNDKTASKNVLSSYRYAFQGQEKDNETGMEAFQLRLWDGRIGRWLTTDPAGQYSSPYLGMGNNPISRIDPDGGKDEPRSFDFSKINNNSDQEIGVALSWHWEGDDLVADLGDNIYTLMDFLNISEADSRGLMSSMGVFSNAKDVLQLKENQRFNKSNILAYTKSKEITPTFNNVVAEGKYETIRVAYDFREKFDGLYKKAIEKGVPYLGSQILKRITGVGGLLSGFEGNKYEQGQLNIMRGLHPLYPQVQWRDSVIFIPIYEGYNETARRKISVRNHLLNSPYKGLIQY